MQRYRLFLIDHRGRLEHLEPIEAGDDQAAIAHGLTIDRGPGSLEIWCDLRLVAVLWAKSKAETPAQARTRAASPARPIPAVYPLPAP
jgi:hypothetical protein